MSASSKKKLRKELEAAKLTEKQLAAQQEAKKVNLYTTLFVVAMAVILVIAVTVGIKQTIASHGIMEKKTVAMTVGDNEISNAELSYFYMDNVNNFLNTYGSYAAMFGLDTGKPLNEQFVDEEEGLTWADDFLNAAKNTAKTAYTLADAAEAAGFSLSAEEVTALESVMENLNLVAPMNGYASGEAYLKAIYGNGASEEGYLEYMKLTALADAYYQEYAKSLTYGEDVLRAKDAENPGAYDSYDFNSYYLAANKFYEGGTTAEDGTTTYSDAEKAAGAAAAEEAANSLIAAEIVTAADLDAAIAALEINKDTTASSTANTGVLSSSISSLYTDWVTDSSRKAGDKTVVANTSTDAEGNETVNGYYVLMFGGSSKNEIALANVRHILVSFEHGTEVSEDHDHSATGYTDEEKAAAKAAAEEILAQWNEGEKTEDSFAALAIEKSTDTGSASNGGLYENVFPGRMVPAFNDWCFDESRASGDTGIVESDSGYHVMYYVGDADITYRDYMIAEELRSNDVSQWYSALVESATVTEGDTKYINTDLVLTQG